MTKKPELNISVSVFDVPEMELKIKDLEVLSLKKEFWENQNSAREVLQKKTKLTESLDKWKRFNNEIKDIEHLWKIALQEKDDQILQDINDELDALKAAVFQEELKMMLSSEQDHMDAIVSIHAGAGGTEAQDWVEMLLRMYLRWAEKREFETKIIDILTGEEAGLKNVTFMVNGRYAYGYLKAESGIHRLVRISPFDAGARRHTSFASVFVIPEVSDDIVVEIDEKDLRVDTFRSSGAGGQHVNKTDLAVRITHLPTGIVVQFQNERSQTTNKQTALRILKSRLAELEEEKREAELARERGAAQDIGF